MDFIITWVDGNDPEWQKEYILYKEKETGDKTAARFRDWENLQYWFRGIEKFAPWVDKIHFVTWGHVPAWLNTNHPKLHIVNHKDYIPEKYLPTFNSHTIELNFHRIKELSDEYVYFNDDMFLINHLREEDFFKNGKPCDMAQMAALRGSFPFHHILLNNIMVLNRHFYNKLETVKKKPSNWFNLRHRKRSLRNLMFLYLYKKKHTGFQDYHLQQPSLKSILEEIWQKEYKIMDDTSSHKFRTLFDVSPYLQRYWQLASNNFHPVNMYQIGTKFTIREELPEDVFDFIINQKKPSLCLNDYDTFPQESFLQAKEKIKEAFNHILPEKCSFEN